MTLNLSLFLANNVLSAVLSNAGDETDDDITLLLCLLPSIFLLFIPVLKATFYPFALEDEKKMKIQVFATRVIRFDRSNSGNTRVFKVVQD